MASSNRHWPSMFKSKPCNSHSHHHHPHQWQHDINSPLMSPASCHRSPYTSVAGSEERSPEPKPRWNPKPEQIRILEAIFNSGMVNPPRDEIRKIRAQLQEYGQVGDANVFYWFQNRKSRSKHKLRLLQNSKNQTPSSQTTAPSSSSSSSSEKSSPKDITPSKGFSIGFSNVTDVIPNSPTASVNQTYFQTHNETTLAPSAEHFFFPLHHHNGGSGGVANAITQGFSFSELSNVVQSQAQAPDHQQNVGSYNSLLLSEIMNHEASKKDQEKAMKMHQHPHLSFCVSSTPITDDSTVPPISTTTVTVPSPLTQIQGVVEAGACGGTAKSTVFINDVAFEVGVGPFDVRAAFGDDVVLVHASGQPVLTNEWGVTLQSLQHGAFYYLI